HWCSNSHWVLRWYRRNERLGTGLTVLQPGAIRYGGSRVWSGHDFLHGHAALLEHLGLVPGVCRVGLRYRRSDCALPLWRSAYRRRLGDDCCARRALAYFDLCRCLHVAAGWALLAQPLWHTPGPVG